MMIEGTSWSTALAVGTTDLTGGRRKGSAWCKCNSSMALKMNNHEKLIILRLGGGGAGTRFFMDPTTGIAVVFGVQVYMPPDLEVNNLVTKLEHTLYEGLNIGI